jgi:hypothetical protein
MIKPIAVNDQFVLRGVRHIITAVTETEIKYRTANTTRTPYNTTRSAFESLADAGIIIRVEPVRRYQ